jgi:hypothetical protein
VVACLAHTGPGGPLIGQLLLDCIEQGALYDRGSLAWQDLTLILDLADIELVAQEIEQRSSLERDATADGAGCEQLRLGADVALLEILEPPFRRAVPTTPAVRGCTCRLLPRLCSRPQLAGGSASALSLSRCSGFTHVTARRIAQPPYGDLCREAPTQPVTRPSCSLATGPIDNFPVESSSTDGLRLRGARATCDMKEAAN